MAFCRSKKSKEKLYVPGKQSRSPSIVPNTLPPRHPPYQVYSPSKKSKRDFLSRQQAQKALMSFNEKKSFTVKLSLKETRFTHKDLEDLQKRFEKNSQWVLVNFKGEAFKDEDCNDDEEPSIELYNEDDDKVNGSKKFNPNKPIVKQETAKSIISQKYKKLKISLDGKMNPLLQQTHYEQRMSKRQFRECMGLLGLESNAFLSDRIFEVVDGDRDEYISFLQFCTIMDTLIHGDEDEKQEFSFSLIEGKMGGGYFDFKEFCDFINKIIAHWCIMTGSQVNMNEEGLKQIFNQMNPVNGVVDLEQYKKALKENPQLFQWFDLLNGAIVQTAKPEVDKTQILKIKKSAVSDIQMLQNQISSLLSQFQEYEQTSQQIIATQDKSVKSSVISNFDMSQIPKQNFVYDSELQNPNASHYVNSLRKTSVSNYQSPAEPLSKTHSFKQKETMSQQRRGSGRLKHNSVADQNLERTQKLYLTFKQLVNPDPDLIPRSPKADDLFFDQQRFPSQSNPSELYPNKYRPMLIESPKSSNVVEESHYSSKPNKPISYEKQLLIQLKEEKDLKREMKSQFGEKRAQIQEIQKKYDSNSSDSEVMEDPESEEDKVEQLDNSKRQVSQKVEYQSPIPNANNGGQWYLHSQEEKKVMNNENPVIGSFKSQRSNFGNSLGNNNNMKYDIQQAFGKQKFRSRVQNSQITNFGQQRNLNLNTMSSDRETSPAQTYDELRSEPQGGPNQSTPLQNQERFPRQKTSNNTDLDQTQLLMPKINIDKLASEKFVVSDQKSHSPSRSPNNKLSEKSQLQSHQIMEQIQQLQRQTCELLQKYEGNDIGRKSSDILHLKPIMEGSDQSEDKKISHYFEEFKSLSDLDKGFQKKQVLSSSGGKDKRPSSSKKKKSIHKPLSKKTSNKSFIHIGHDNWNLVLTMMMGVRQSVKNVLHEEVFEDITEGDFQKKFMYELTSMKTKNMRLFEFYDFSPKIFNRIRKMFGITPEEYRKSIGPENLIGNLCMGNISSLKEQCSTGKSGSFFYYTADGRFMLKTISHQEFIHLKAILKDYFEHLSTYSHTLITRFFGLHKIKYNKKMGKSRIYFVVMANVFNTTREINVRYDLKGSTHGRATKKDPSDSVDPAVALKDLDFLQEKQKIYVSTSVKSALIKQIQADVRLFQRLNINDYSLLLGIHYIEDDEDPDQLEKVSPNIDDLASLALKQGMDADDFRRSFIYSGQGMMKKYQQGYTIPFYEAHDGGILSQDKRCIYFIGIIDTLTVFEQVICMLTNNRMKKKLEYHFKSIAYGYDGKISCIPPHQYGERFFEFISSIFTDQLDPPFNSGN